MFSFHRTTARSWYITWVRPLKIVLTRHMPQPTMELIKSVCPPKFKQMFNGRMMGIVDATELRLQTASEKMAQRNIL
jgi:hypothetical protein